MSLHRVFGIFDDAPSAQNKRSREHKCKAPGGCPGKEAVSPTTSEEAASKAPAAASLAAPAETAVAASKQQRAQACFKSAGVACFGACCASASASAVGARSAWSTEANMALRAFARDSSPCTEAKRSSERRTSSICANPSMRCTHDTRVLFSEQIRFKSATSRRRPRFSVAEAPPSANASTSSTQTTLHAPSAANSVASAASASTAQFAATSLPSTKSTSEAKT
mmetsp:Transcript_7305/g.23800  ORF Transcript_7305/g.23800 Transcript_7305/m.23800 type:complete len:224 (-) Transcript_7305:1-672(-)